MSSTIPSVLRRKVGDRYYYFGTIQSDKTKSVTFVPVIENTPNSPLNEQTEEGYQRPGSTPRMNKFRNFLKDNPNSIVPPVLLCGRGNWSFQHYNSNQPDYGELEINGAAAILDGQHRLGGYVMLVEKDEQIRNVDFVLLDELAYEEEIREFVTVNDTQVGVPKSLSAYLGIEIDEDGSENTWIAWQLNLREDSPFIGKITRTKMTPEHLFQLHSVAKNIDRTFKNGAFNSTDRADKMEFLIQYWTIIQDAHSALWSDIEKLGAKGQGRKAFDSKLLELTGFIAWSLVADQVLASSYNSSSNSVDWERVEKMVSLLRDRIDWDKQGEYAGRTGEVGGRYICNDMQAILSEQQF